MNHPTRLFLLLAALTVLLLSIPFLVPHCGWLALIGWVPLLCLEHIASQTGIRRLWPWHYGTFVLWNAATTFWVCNATLGGGLFAIFANALQMSLIFGLFRLSKKHFTGVVPYLFLALAWIAWERWYLTSAQISWPWLVLGNAFARSTGLVQWYEYTGTLGGSLWVWAVNLSVFGMMVNLSDGSWRHWNGKARAAAVIGLVALLVLCDFTVNLQVAVTTHLNQAGVIGKLILQPIVEHRSHRSPDIAGTDGKVCNLYGLGLGIVNAGTVELVAHGASHCQQQGCQTTGQTYLIYPSHIVSVFCITCGR